MKMFDELVRENPKEFKGRDDQATELIKEYESLLSYEEGETLVQAKAKRKVKDDWDRVGEAVKVIADAVNGLRTEEVSKMLCLGLVKQHRTLQQQTVSALYRMFDHYRHFGYDGRNKAATLSAEVVTQSLKEAQVYLPLI